MVQRLLSWPKEEMVNGGRQVAGEGVLILKDEEAIPRHRKGRNYSADAQIVARSSQLLGIWMPEVECLEVMSRDRAEPGPVCHPNGQW